MCREVHLFRFGKNKSEYVGLIGGMLSFPPMTRLKWHKKGKKEGFKCRFHEEGVEAAHRYR